MLLFIFLFAFGEATGNDVIDLDLQVSSITSLTHFYPSCFTENKTWSTEEVIDFLGGIDTPYSCQNICLEFPNCLRFTWYDSKSTPLNFTCFLFGQTSAEVPCNSCVSGPRLCPTTTTTSTPTSSPTPPNCLIPQLQEHGYWFCPPSISPSTCHLECDPGYVSNNGTVVTCQHGEWSSSPRCVEALGLITGTRGSWDPITNDWERNPCLAEVYGEGVQKKLPDLPDSKFYHSLDFVDSMVLLCGGHLSNTLCLTLTPSLQWKHHSTTLFHHSSHSSVTMLGKLYLLGGDLGEDEVYRNSRTEVLSPLSDQWSQSWDLEGDVEGCAVKIEAELFVLTSAPTGRSAVLYNVTSGAVTRLQNQIYYRWQHGCAYIKDSKTKFRGVLLAGGAWSYYPNYPAHHTSEVFDIERGEWSVTGNLTTPRLGVRMVVLGEDILAMGGEGTQSSVSVEKFQMASWQWTGGKNMMENRNFHAVTGVPPSAVGIGLY